MRALILISFLLFQSVVFGSSSDSLISLLERSAEEDRYSIFYQHLKSLESLDSIRYYNELGKLKDELASYFEEKLLEGTIAYRAGKWQVHRNHPFEGLKVLAPLNDSLQESDFHSLRSKVLSGISEIYNNLGDLDKSLASGLEAFNHAKANDLKKEVTIACIALGEVYRELSEHEEAIRFCDEGLENARLLKDSFDLPRLLNNKGISLVQLKRFDEAIATLEEGHLITVETNSKFGQSRLLTNLGFLYKRMEKFDKALDYYFQSLELKTEMDDRKSMAYTLNDIGETYFFKGDFKSAIGYSRRALSLAKEENAISYMRDMSKTISTSFDAAGQKDSALYYFKQYHTLGDSILNLDNLRALAQLEKQHEFDQQELLNDLLRLENRHHEADLATQRWIILGFLIMFFGLSAITMLFWRSNRARKKLLSQLGTQNLQLDRSNDELRRLLSEQDSLFNIVTHDLKGPLVNILQILELEDGNPDPNDKAELRALLSTSAHDAARFIEEFNTLLEFEKKNELPPLEEVDLNLVLKSILDEFSHQISKKKIEVHFNEQQPHKIQSVESMVHHMLHNLVSNAVKFSPKDSNIFVTISLGSSTRISIEDQGAGIAIEDQERIFDKFYKSGRAAGKGVGKSNGLGLPLVKLLVHKLGGKISVKSTEGEGSEFRVHLP